MPVDEDRHVVKKRGTWRKTATSYRLSFNKANLHVVSCRVEPSNREGHSDKVWLLKEPFSVGLTIKWYFDGQK